MILAEDPNGRVVSIPVQDDSIFPAPRLTVGRLVPAPGLPSRDGPDVEDVHVAKDWALRAPSVVGSEEHKQAQADHNEHMNALLDAAAAPTFGHDQLLAVLKHETTQFASMLDKNADAYGNRLWTKQHLLDRLAEIRRIAVMLGDGLL